MLKTERHGLEEGLSATVTVDVKDGLGCTGQDQQPCMVLHPASDMDGFGDRADAIELQIGEIQIKFKGQRLAGTLLYISATLETYRLQMC